MHRNSLFKREIVSNSGNAYFARMHESSPEGNRELFIKLKIIPRDTPIMRFEQPIIKIKNCRKAKYKFPKLYIIGYICEIRSK